METNNQDEVILEDEQLSDQEKKDAIQNGLATIPEAEKKGIMKVITEDDLIKIGGHKKKLASFKRKYGNGKIKFTNVDDEAMISLAEDAARDLRKFRTGIDNERKELVAPMNNGVKFVNSKYNPIIDDSKTLEDPIKTVREEFKAAKEAKAKEAELAKQKRVNDRVDVLQKAGMAFDGEYYSIGSEEFGVDSITIGLIDLETTPDGVFDNILSQIISKAAAIKTATEEKEAKLLAEKKQREEQEAEEKRKFKEEQDKLQKEKDDLAKQMADFKKQQEELQAQQDKLTQQKLEEANRLLKIEQDKKDALNKERKLQLIELGLVFDGWKGYFSSIYKELEAKVHLSTIEDATNEAWIEIMNSVRITVEQQKQLIEKDKKIADEKAAADKIIADKAIADKAIEDKKKQDEADDLARKNELMKKGDLAVWNDFVSRLKAISFPEMKSDEFIANVKRVKDFITEL
jgi:hypothetical protein